VKCLSHFFMQDLEPPLILYSSLFNTSYGNTGKQNSNKQEYDKRKRKKNNDSSTLHVNYVTFHCGYLSIWHNKSAWFLYFIFQHGS